MAQGLCGESHIIKGVSVHVSRADPKDDASLNSSVKYSHSVQNFNQYNREFENRRFTPHQHSQSYHHLSTQTKGSKSRKFEQNSFDSYDRRNEIRSPNVSSNFSNNSNSAMNSISNKNFGNKDQLSAMMNMFNPMMAAFIQQLATQSNMMPQAQMDIHKKNPSHHHNPMSSGVPAPIWTNANGSLVANHVDPSTGLSISANHNYKSRYSNDKRF